MDQHPSMRMKLLEYINARLSSNTVLLGRLSIRFESHVLITPACYLCLTSRQTTEILKYIAAITRFTFVRAVACIDHLATSIRL
jgi:CRP-like cAMP-binding protein